ncbi:MAG: peptide-methionine (S)-S-oxide reductase [Schlesneria sp.]|nr:peptide-methionine (S)-S-oxide reductase [Schlesneria sp.]
MRAVRLAMVSVVIGMIGLSLIKAAEIKSPRVGPRAPDGQPIKATTGDASQGPAQGLAAPAAKKTETAVFAGGCFWCTEFAFEQVAGVVEVESGYCGGTKATANYDRVHLGTTAHAEAIRVTYDTNKVSYEDLLAVFFDAHDPTQLNRQGEGDVGRQYRSAIFFADDEQKKLAEAKIADLEAKKVHKKRIVTKLEPLKEFYPAEAYHQDFARRNPYLPYIQAHSIPKAMQVRTKHPELIRNGN